MNDLDYQNRLKTLKLRRSKNGPQRLFRSRKVRGELGVHTLIHCRGEAFFFYF